MVTIQWSKFLVHSVLLNIERGKKLLAIAIITMGS
jgi:hypothetical protein